MGNHICDECVGSDEVIQELCRRSKHLTVGDFEDTILELIKLIEESNKSNADVISKLINAIVF